MTDNEPKALSITKLRRRAEALIRTKPLPPPPPATELSFVEAARALHELRVHEVELELQNEELRSAQLELTAARAKYFDLYDTAPIGYVTLSAEGMIQEANLTAATMFATKRGELVNQPFHRYVLKQDKELYGLARTELLKASAPQAFELRMAADDGKPFWARINATASHNGDGAMTCRFAISDITKQKLEQREKERLEEQLSRVRKTESVGRLAGGVAHNFNNMLMVILGYTEIAMEQLGRDEPLYEDLEKIHDAAQSSAELTRQLLVFASKQTISPMEQDLNLSISGGLKMIERLIGENIKVLPHFAEGLWPVFVDPSQIDQIVLNLCLNARDAITEGAVAADNPGTVTIETANVSLGVDYCVEHPGCSPGEYVLVSVSDNGRGMSAETLANVFEPFFTTKGIGYGTGLGLATVYGAVTQNRGFIMVESTLEKGSTFKVFLPRHTGPATAVKSSLPAASANGTLLHGSETVLLVEDDEAILAMTSSVLRSLGYKVYTSSAPVEALILAQRHAEELDLLITDVVMPEMSGNVLARKVAEIAPHVKLLFMSGFTADLIDRHGVLDKVTNFIQKPFSVKHLALKVREVLEGRLQTGIGNPDPADRKALTPTAPG